MAGSTAGSGTGSLTGAAGAACTTGAGGAGGVRSSTNALAAMGASPPISRDAPTWYRRAFFMVGGTDLCLCSRDIMNPKGEASKPQRKMTQIAFDARKDVNLARGLTAWKSVG